MRNSWFKAFDENEAGPSHIPSLHRNPELEGFYKLRSIHPKHTFNPPKDNSELWDFPPPPNADRYYLWPKEEAKDDDWHQNTWQCHRDSFFREKARFPSDVWSRTKMTKIMRTRIRKYKGHSYIAFDIERPGSLTSTLSEADFPNLNQHDIKTIIRWLRTASNLGVPTKLFI